MDIKVFEDYSSMCRKIAEEIADIVRKKPDSLLCLAAGHTSLGIFDEMAAMSDAGLVSYDECIFVGLDEWAGKGADDDGSCFGFMKKNLFDRLNISGDRIVFYDGRSDLDYECLRIDSYVKQKGPLDYVLLGMGMNGHLGLNEPGTPFEKYSHVVVLDQTTKTVGQKYFRAETELTGGITMGMLHFKEAVRVVLAVNGAKKAELTARLIASDPTEKLPASYLKTLGSASLYLDKEAASNIAAEINSLK